MAETMTGASSIGKRLGDDYLSCSELKIHVYVSMRVVQIVAHFVTEFRLITFILWPVWNLSSKSVLILVYRRLRPIRNAISTHYVTPNGDLTSSYCEKLFQRDSKMLDIYQGEDQRVPQAIILTTYGLITMRITIFNRRCDTKSFFTT